MKQASGSAILSEYLHESILTRQMKILRPVKITIYHRQAANAYGYSGVYNHLERAISVDMYDNLSMNHIWHCAAVGELEYDPEQRAAGLPELVTRIFERYPVEASEGI